MKAKLARPGDGTPLNLTLLSILRAEDTAGSHSLMLLTLEPNTGAPLHVHKREDETLYVLEGTLELSLNGETHDAPQGSTVFLPKGSPHSFRNPGSEPARILIMAVPGGLEGFFEALAGEGAQARAEEILREYEIAFL